MRPLAAVAFVALVGSITGLARADDVDSVSALALFRGGKILADNGNYPAACPKFEASYRLVKKLGTLLNLADCYERTGRTASAWVLFAEGKAIAEKTAQADRVAFAAEHEA